MSGSSSSEGGKGRAGKAAKSSGSKKAKSSAPGADRSAADLVQALADKDRQLRDLTEQSLGFLEELAEVRRHEGERKRLAARIDELERLLADLQRRLRGTAVRAHARPDGEEKTLPWEIVFWGASAASEAVAAAVEMPEGTVTWVGVPDDLPPAAEGRAGVQWVTAREARSPAQCWNLAMAATRAPWVLLLAAEARPEGELDLPDGSVPPSVALLVPRLLRGESEELGMHEPGGLLHLLPLSVPRDRDPPSLPFASPEAFCVRRAAFESIGLFDEGLLGRLALADYALRARAVGYELRAAPELRVRVSEDGAVPDEVDRDLLLVLASHRPEDLGRALAELPVLWELDRAQVPAFVTGLLDRAVGRDPPARQRDLVATIAAGMVAQTVPKGRKLAVLHQRCLELLRGLEGEPAPPPAAGGDAAMADMTVTMAAVVERLEEDRERLRVLEQLAQAAEKERGAAQERAHLLQKEFEAIATAVDLVRQPQPAHVRERLLELKTEADQLSRVLDAAGVPDAGALIQNLFEVRQRLAETDKVLTERNRWIALLLHEVCKRRLFPRALQDHERDFLDQLGPSP